MPNSHLPSTLGKHFTADMHLCKNLPDDPNKIRKILETSAKKMGATVIGSFFHKFLPHGISGVIVIAESHITIHTWPENCFAAVDIFSCGNIDPEYGIECIAKQLKPQRMETNFFARGLDLQ